METWLIFTIASVFFSWFTNFIFKVIWKRNYDTSYVLFLRYIISSILAWLFYLYNYWFLNIGFNIIYILLWIWLIKAILNFFIWVFKVEWLKYIDISLFMPIYKTIWIILVTLSSFIIFNETLSDKNIIWILIWILVPIFLINKKENSLQINLKKWIIYTITWTMLLTVSSSINKYVVIESMNIELFTFIWLSLWIVVSYIKYKKDERNITNLYNIKWIYLVSFILWLLSFLTTISFMYALKWNLAVVYTLNSFSILIPIVLSVIFYKEKMTLKKVLVILLSMISVIFFI